MNILGGLNCEKSFIQEVSIDFGRTAAKSSESFSRLPLTLSPVEITAGHRT